VCLSSNLIDKSMQLRENDVERSASSTQKLLHHQHQLLNRRLCQQSRNYSALGLRTRAVIEIQLRSAFGLPADQLTLIILVDRLLHHVLSVFVFSLQTPNLFILYFLSAGVAGTSCMHWTRRVEQRLVLCRLWCPIQWWCPTVHWLLNFFRAV